MCIIFSLIKGPNIKDHKTRGVKSGKFLSKLDYKHCNRQTALDFLVGLAP